MNFKYHQIYKKEQQYLRYQNCKSLGATYIKYRVKCTGGSRTYKGVSSRSMNFKNAFLDLGQRGAQLYIQVHRGCCARPSQTCWLAIPCHYEWLTCLSIHLTTMSAPPRPRSNRNWQMAWRHCFPRLDEKLTTRSSITSKGLKAYWRDNEWNVKIVDLIWDCSTLIDQGPRCVIT
jgi:hypothetical protein